MLKIKSVLCLSYLRLALWLQPVCALANVLIMFAEYKENTHALTDGHKLRNSPNKTKHDLIRTAAAWKLPISAYKQVLFGRLSGTGR